MKVFKWNARWNSLFNESPDHKSKNEDEMWFDLLLE